MLPLREKSWMGLLLGSFLNCKQRSEGKKKGNRVVEVIFERAEGYL